jgi:hypothetical protein
MSIMTAAEATPYALKRMAAYQRKGAPSRAALIAAAERIAALENRVRDLEAALSRRNARDARV